MPQSKEKPALPTVRLRRILLGTFLAILAILLYLTVYHFVVALTWAAILVLSLWPLFRRLKESWPERIGLVSLLTTIGLGLIIVVPLGFVAILLVGELRQLGQTLGDLITGREGNLAESVKDLPFVGDSLSQWLVEVREDPSGVTQWFLNENRERLLAAGQRVVQAISENLFHFFVCMFATYFLFRHGELLGGQIVRGVERLGGAHLLSLMQHIQRTVKAVVYGLVMTAIAQAIVASFGFWLFGVPYPLLLGSMMFFVSFIPFGPPFIWIPASLILLSRTEYLSAVLMFIYGAAIISMMDNVFRPLFIGQATKMSVLLVFVGVLGGIFSFGMVGLFVGPVVIAVALALWREWVAVHPEATLIPAGEKVKRGSSESE